MTIETTASGLQYEDVVVGDGAEATAGKYDTVHYTGWLYENGQAGKKFDSGCVDAIEKAAAAGDLTPAKAKRASVAARQAGEAVAS